MEPQAGDASSAFVAGHTEFVDVVESVLPTAARVTWYRLTEHRQPTTAVKPALMRLTQLAVGQCIIATTEGSAAHECHPNRTSVPSSLASAHRPSRVAALSSQASSTRV